MLSVYSKPHREEMSFGGRIVSALRYWFIILIKNKENRCKILNSFHYIKQKKNLQRKNVSMFYRNQMKFIIILTHPYAWYSYRAVGCLLRLLDLRIPSFQVVACFGWTKFIAWCLRCPIRGMPTGSWIFYLPRTSLNWCEAPIIKHPCATLWHSRKSDKSSPHVSNVLKQSWNFNRIPFPTQGTLQTYNL